MKKFKLIPVLIFIFSMPCFAVDQKIFDLKQNGFALYNTNHINEAYELLKQIPKNDMDEEILLILANIEEDKNADNKAAALLKQAVEKNPEFYKAYYNLGCIYMKKRIYSKAIENFELAIKNNKQNPYAYYNLACAQINSGKYKNAKKNLIKAIYLKNDEKNFYYNLAYVNKKLNKQKDAQKIIDFYNQNFVK